MSTTAEAIEHLLPHRRVMAVEMLLSSDRTRVERVTLVSGEGRMDRVVVKRYFASSGFVAEAAALSVLPAGLPTPTLIAEGRAERLVVMSDAGEGSSVADALLGVDPAAAEEALGAWAEALAQVHRATGNLRGSFAAAVAERDPDAVVTTDPMLDWLAGVPDALRTSGALEVPGGLDDELAALGSGLHEQAWEALSPGDTCPDNNVVTGRGLTLIDFEEAAFRHVAWDLAYLRVPWPSCWCAWGIPEPVASAALSRYFAAMAGTVVGADRATFDRIVEQATLAWALISASWFLPSGLRRDDTMGGPPGLAAPRRRATVLERFRVAADTAENQGYATVAAAARSWRQALQRVWGPQRLPIAPALR